MQKTLQLLFISVTLSSLFAQDIWGGASVATPDNLNAISGNPAGLGILRGKQFGIYIPFDSVFTIHRSVRFSGFGFDLKYQSARGCSRANRNNLIRFQPSYEVQECRGIWIATRNKDQADIDQQYYAVAELRIIHSH